MQDELGGIRRSRSNQYTSQQGLNHCECHCNSDPHIDTYTANSHVTYRGICIGLLYLLIVGKKVVLEEVTGVKK